MQHQMIASAHMDGSKVNSLLGGPAAYEPHSGWPWLAAIPAAVLIFAVATIGGGAAVTGLAVALGAKLQPLSDMPADDLQIRVLMLTLLVVQAVIIVLTVLAADRFGYRAGETLALAGPRVAASVYVKAFAGMVGILIVLDIIAVLVGPQNVVQDLKPFARFIQSDSWWLTLLAVGVGAPLSEELLFRGFLFSSIAKTRLGIAGAALLTTAGWTALHGNYSVMGLLQVAAIGLYLSWVLWRTGSLRVTIFCHALYNTLLTVALSLIKLPA